VRSPASLVAAVVTTATTVASLALPALAQQAPPPGPPPADPVGDYRWALYSACTVAFLAITAFLVFTHLRTRKAAEQIGVLERRLDALEGPPPPREHGT
jgi:hypothetical protein